MPTDIHKTNNGAALKAPVALAKDPHKTPVTLAVAAVILKAVAVAIYQPYCPPSLVCSIPKLHLLRNRFFAASSIAATPSIVRVRRFF